MKLVRIQFFSSILALAFCVTGCTTPRNTITQFCTIDALLAGAYEGEMPCRTLTRRGDMGIGTFNKLDGEMVLLDGHVYQVRSDGKVYSPDRNVTTPFASVIDFRPEKSRSVPAGLTYPQFQKLVDEMLPHTNVLCAFRFNGTFRQMRTRSVPAQSKPYRQLIEVTREQAVFELDGKSGAMVGFRMPEFVKGINVPGFHAHFLTDDRQAGGHVLAFTTEGGTLEIATSSRMEILLPKNPEMLGGIDFSRDRSKELEKVEK